MQLQLVAVVAAYPLAGLGRASAWASERTAAVVMVAGRWVAGDRANFRDLLAGAIAERERNVELGELAVGGRTYLADLGVEAVVVSPCAVTGTIRLYVMEGVYEDGARLSSRVLRIYAERRVGTVREKAEHPIGQPLGGPECHPGITLRWVNPFEVAIMWHSSVSFSSRKLCHIHESMCCPNSNSRDVGFVPFHKNV